MKSDTVVIKRVPWGYDPSWDYCVAYDPQGNHLGVSWCGKPLTPRMQRVANTVTRRNWIAAGIAALPAMLSLFFSGPRKQEVE